MAIHTGAKATEVKLAVLEVKIDGIKTDMSEDSITMKAHILADAEAFRQVLEQLDILKAFRWQVYGALILVSALVGAVAWLRVLKILP